jgi:hypothetical protein
MTSKPWLHHVESRLERHVAPILVRKIVHHDFRESPSMNTCSAQPGPDGGANCYVAGHLKPFCWKGAGREQKALSHNVTAARRYSSMLKPNNPEVHALYRAITS